MARSKKEISTIVSGAGLLTRVFSDLDKEVRALGGTDEDWHRLTTPEGVLNIQRMAEVMVNEPILDPTAGEWRITSGPRTLERMIEACGFSHVGDDVFKKFRKVPDQIGAINVEAVLVYLNYPASSEIVRKIMAMNGLRPADIGELLAFSVAAPDAQRRLEIFALGSTWYRPSDGESEVPYLSGNQNSRYLQVQSEYGNWGPAARFLAIKKK